MGCDCECDDDLAVTAKSCTDSLFSMIYNSFVIDCLWWWWICEYMFTTHIITTLILCAYMLCRGATVFLHGKPAQYLPEVIGKKLCGPNCVQIVSKMHKNSCTCICNLQKNFLGAKPPDPQWEGTPSRTHPPWGPWPLNVELTLPLL